MKSLSEKNIELKSHYLLMNHHLLNIYSNPENFLIYYTKIPSNKMPFMITQTFNNTSERFFYVKKARIEDAINSDELGIFENKMKLDGRLAYLYVSEKNLTYKDILVYKVLHKIEIQTLDKN